MTMRGIVLGIAALFLLLSPVPAFGQERLTVESVDATGYPDVTVTVAAPEALTGQELASTAFTLSENGDARAVEATRVGSDELAVALVMDLSGSMEGRPIVAAREAAATFLDRIPEAVPVALVGFRNEPEVLAGLNSTRDEVRAAVAGLEASGGTALYDAIMSALALLPKDNRIHRAVLVLSDGGDKSSTTKLDTLTRTLSQGTVRVDAVGLTTPDSDVDALKTITDAAGGDLVTTTDASVLEDLYAEAAGQLSSLYRLTYRAQASGPSTVNVIVDHNDVVAETTHTVNLPASKVAPAPLLGKELTLELLDQRWVLLAAAGSVFLALSVLLIGLLKPATPRVRMSRANRGEGTASRVVERLAMAADESLARHHKAGTLNAKLESAGLQLRPGEFVVFTGMAVVAAAAVGLLLAGALLALALGITAFFGSRILLRVRRDRRRAAFRSQLSDSLQLLAGSLRAGYGTMQAIDALANEASEPTAEEFRRLLIEVRLGRDFDEALSALAQRIRLEDLDWVVQAIQIHRDVGGDLAEVLDAVAKTVREREQVRGQVRALSAEGRLSAYVLLALPVFMAFAVSAVQPGYLQDLVTTLLGKVMLALCLLLLIVGFFWIRRLVRVVF